MRARYIFHLSLVVADLEAAKDFYVRFLQARIGRETAEWVDILLWGHQITLHQDPDAVEPMSPRADRHFGATLPWEEWESAVQRLREGGVVFHTEPAVIFQGSPREQAKFYLADPSNNLIEVKAYRDVLGTLGLVP